MLISVPCLASFHHPISPSWRPSRLVLWRFSVVQLHRCTHLSRRLTVRRLRRWISTDQSRSSNPGGGEADFSSAPKHVDTQDDCTSASVLLKLRCVTLPVSVPSQWLLQSVNQSKLQYNDVYNVSLGLSLSPSCLSLSLGLSQGGSQLYQHIGSMGYYGH